MTENRIRIYGNVTEKEAIIATTSALSVKKSFADGEVVDIRGVVLIDDCAYFVLADQEAPKKFFATNSRGAMRTLDFIGQMFSQISKNGVVQIVVHYIDIDKGKEMVNIEVI